MKNIVLIGMPSSGKTYIGLLLAKRCGYGFIDSDLLIQNDQKALLCDIIAREGAEGFIAIEERINAELWAQRCIIATGGSVVYGDRAMRHLKEIGKVVYLKLDAGEVCRRIKNFTRRGVVMRGDVHTLTELYEERAPLYEKYADVTVDLSGKKFSEAVSLVKKAAGVRR